jgi:uncharacterized protein (DUF2345 family)
VDDQDEVAKQLKAQNEAVKGDAKSKGAGEEGKFPELAEPHLIMASPAGIQSTTPQTTHMHSGQHHAITSGGHTSISTGRSLLASVKEHLRLFAQQGIRIFSAKGKVQLQAQDNEMELIAKKVIEIMSTSDWINATAAKGIRIQSGPTELTITPEGFKVVTPGYDMVHAADHQTFTPASATPITMPNLANTSKSGGYETSFDAGPLLHTDSQITGGTYEVWTAEEKPQLLIAGELDATGRTLSAHTEAPTELVLIVGEHDWEDVVHVQDIANKNRTA